MSRLSGLIRSRPWAWGGIAVIVLLGIGWFSWRPEPTDAWTVVRAPLLRTVQFSARVATRSRVDVGSTVTGRVVQVLVDEGDAVRAGQPLLRLEPQELQAALAQARASEQQAQARLHGLRGNVRTQSAAALAQAEANLRTAQADLNRVQQQVVQGFVSAARRDEAERVVAVARAQQQAAQAQVQANAEGGAEWRQAQAQWDNARASRALALAKLEQAEVRSPTAARVLVRSVEPGQIVQPGRALLALALDGPVQLKAQVDERYLEQLAPGQVAHVVADAYVNQRWRATVQRIAPAVDVQRGAVEVTLGLDGPAPEFLREDMTLSVEVETGRREQALSVPLAALRGSVQGDAAQVLVVDGGRAQWRRLRLGLRTLETAEVLEGLQAGDQVLLAAGVEPGQRVRPRATTHLPVAGSDSSSNAAAAGTALSNAIGR
ncbi:MAG TPA: efflux RND transporter periplasmic adaptor subunit [Macromonas sp.]|nr:efflux RND transporter periplasmic adaptor subunit [Macromonas sp.]